MTFLLAVNIFFTKIVVHQVKAKTGRQVIRHVECFKNPPSPLSLFDDKAGSSRYNLVAACRQRQLSAITVYVRNINLLSFTENDLRIALLE